MARVPGKKAEGSEERVFCVPGALEKEKRPAGESVARDGEKSDPPSGGGEIRKRSEEEEA